MEGTEINAAGLVLTAAQARAERGDPFAAEFLMMCRQALSAEGGEGLMFTEAMAARRLHPHEGAAVEVAFSALRGAVRARSGDLIVDAGLLGLQLVAKWAEFLVATEGHPHLMWHPGANEDGAIGGA